MESFLIEGRADSVDLFPSIPSTDPKTYSDFKTFLERKSLKTRKSTWCSPGVIYSSAEKEKPKDGSNFIFDNPMCTF
tara:strand:+ start:7966 stop:8196 length:231 start_codon:yes stop_codon:yes gene_type:complete